MVQKPMEGSWLGLGFVSIVAAIWMFTSLAPLGFVLAIIIAIVTVIVGLFKPDAINTWLAQTMHFGKTNGGRFPNFEAQSKAFVALSKFGR
jgi:hypothetical protein